MANRTLLALFLTLMVALATALATLSPPSVMPMPGGSDKIYHFLAFAALALPVATLIPRWTAVAALLLAVYGWLIEIVQPYFGRSRDFEDQIANMSGILCGSLIGLAFYLVFLRSRRSAASGRATPSEPSSRLSQSG